METTTGTAVPRHVSVDGPECDGLAFESEVALAVLDLELDGDAAWVIEDLVIFAFGSLGTGGIQALEAGEEGRLGVAHVEEMDELPLVHLEVCVDVRAGGEVVVLEAALHEEAGAVGEQLGHGIGEAGMVVLGEEVHDVLRAAEALELAAVLVGGFHKLSVGRHFKVCVCVTTPRGSIDGPRGMSQ